MCFFSGSIQASLHLLQLLLQVLHPQAISQGLTMGYLKTRLCLLLLPTHKSVMQARCYGCLKLDHSWIRKWRKWAHVIWDELPENLQQLVLRFALFRQRNVQCTLTGWSLQTLSHLAAHRLDLLVQESVLPLKLLVAFLHIWHSLLHE